MSSKDLLPNLFTRWLYSNLLYNQYPELPIPLNDQEYDKLSTILLKNWDEFNHPHKGLVQEGDLSTGGSMVFTRKSTPKIIASSCNLWLDDSQDQLECKNIIREWNI